MTLRHIWAALLLFGLSFGAARADQPVVIELYTSQGCSSCPPADALLKEIANDEDVIALALHVDYWDYIGWADTFANPAYSDRQRLYARAAGKRMIYTPQMVIAGQEHIEGYRPGAVEDAIRRHGRAAPAVDLSVQRGGERLRISAKRLRSTAPMIVQLVRYTPLEEVSIQRGENAGRSIDYANIVTSWQVIHRWNGQSDLAIEADAPGDAPLVVIVQAENAGPILAAQALR